MPRTTEGWIPKQDRSTLKCKECGEDKPPAEFNTHGTTKSGHKAYNSRCKQCGHKHSATLPSGRFKYRGAAEQKRTLLLEAKKQCAACGYDRCADALDCHHIDETTKLFELSDGVINRNVTVKMFEDELMKCAILCARCHREYHAGLEVTF